MKEKWFWLALIAGLWYLHSQSQQQAQDFVGPKSPCPDGQYPAATVDGQPVCLPMPSTNIMPTA